MHTDLIYNFVSCVKFADAYSTPSIAGAAAVQTGCDTVIFVWHIEGKNAYSR